MDLKALLHDFAARLEGVAPALAGDEQATVAAVATDLHDAADQAAAALTPALPAEARPFVPDFLAFLDGEITKAQAAADAKIAAVNAAKAALAPAG